MGSAGGRGDGSPGGQAEAWAPGQQAPDQPSAAGLPPRGGAPAAGSGPSPALPPRRGTGPSPALPPRAGPSRGGTGPSPVLPTRGGGTGPAGPASGATPPRGISYRRDVNPSRGTTAAGIIPPRGTVSGGGSPRRKGPIRGYPPMPGQPGPVYPPGQFSVWNRPSVRASWLGLNGSGAGAPEGDAEPGYSVLATSDPAADATVTQTWAEMDEAAEWSPPPLARDVSAHTDGEGFPGVRRAAGAPRAAFEAAAPAQKPRGRQPGPRESGGLPAAGPPAAGPPAAGPPATGRPPAGMPPASGRAGQAAAGDPATAPPAGGHAAMPAPGDAGGPRATGRGGARGTPDAGRGTGEFRRPGSGGSRPAAAPGRRGGGLARLSHRTLIGLLMAPVLVVVLVVAVTVYFGSRQAPTAGQAAAATSRPAVAPSPTLGPWRDITSQAVDAQPLSTGELYPARFSSGGDAGVRTVDKANTKCTNAVIGSALRAAVSKGGCTQVIRASYLSTDKKIMATIGVLNLVDVAAAEKAGKAAGAAEFIRQLPAAKGPTRKLTQGTGLEEAEVKGHYLILIWTEFADLQAPSGKKQRRELTKFSAGLFAGTANVSLTSRMVTGKPLTP
jgi:hypothetical protein